MQIVTFFDKQNQKKEQYEIPVWNATVANLTLMALGSSAPEILLNVLDTVQDIESKPSELGPSTIVGSAAFNLLVISGLSIIAVDDGKPKAIADTGVFAITSICSLWAYIWLYLTLKEFSEGEIEVWEAWLTLSFFAILVILSYAADRANKYMVDKKKSIEQKREDEKKNDIATFKAKLRKIVLEKGANVVLEVAQGRKVDGISDTKYREIVSLFKQVLQTDDLNSFTLDELHSCVQADSLFERFAYRKVNGVASRKEFIKLKGTKGQVSHDDGTEIKVPNP